MKLLRFFSKRILRKYEEFQPKNRIKIRTKATDNYIKNKNLEELEEDKIKVLERNEDHIKNKIHEYIELGLKDDQIKVKMANYIKNLNKINGNIEDIEENDKSLNFINFDDNTVNDLTNDNINKVNLVDEEVEYLSKINKIVKDMPKNVKDNLITKTKKSINFLNNKNPQINSIIKGYEEALQSRSNDNKISDQASFYQNDLSKRIETKEEIAVSQKLKTLDSDEFKHYKDLNSAHISKEEQEIIDEDIDYTNHNKLYKLEHDYGKTFKQKTDLEVRRISEELKIPKDIVQQSMKEYIFFLKKKEEEKLADKKRKEFKQRKDKIKKLIKEIKETNLSDDTFDHDELYVKRKKLDNKFPILDEYSEMDILKMKNHNEKEKDNYDFRLLRYNNLYDKIIHDVLFKEFKDLPDGLILSLEEIILNETGSTINAFWRLDTLNFNQNPSYNKKYEQLVEKLNIKLNNMEKYIQSRIFKELSLKYPPNVRFFYSKNDMAVMKIQEKISSDVKFFIGDHLSSNQKQVLATIPDKSKRQNEEAKMIHYKYSEVLVNLKENLSNKEHLTKPNIRKILLDSNRIDPRCEVKTKKIKIKKKNKQKNRETEFWNSLIDE